MGQQQARRDQDRCERRMHPCLQSQMKWISSNKINAARRNHNSQVRRPMDFLNNGEMGVWQMERPRVKDGVRQQWRNQGLSGGKAPAVANRFQSLTSSIDVTFHLQTLEFACAMELCCMSVECGWSSCMSISTFTCNIQINSHTRKNLTHQIKMISAHIWCMHFHRQCK